MVLALAVSRTVLPEAAVLAVCMAAAVVVMQEVTAHTEMSRPAVEPFALFGRVVPGNSLRLVLQTNKD